MKVFRIAILEDDVLFMREYLAGLQQIPFLKVVHCCTEVNELLSKVAEDPVDFLLLDIELPGQPMNGIQVAKVLKLPTVFISSNRHYHLENFDALKVSLKIPIDNMGKQFNVEYLHPLLREFCERVDAWKRKRTIRVKPNGEPMRDLDVDAVCWIETKKGTENKMIFLVSEEPIELAKTTIRQLREMGFSEETFVQCGKSALFSKRNSQFDAKGKGISVSFYFEGKQSSHWESVPADKLRAIEKFYL